MDRWRGITAPRLASAPPSAREMCFGHGELDGAEERLHLRLRRDMAGILHHEAHGARGVSMFPHVDAPCGF